MEKELIMFAVEVISYREAFYAIHWNFFVVDIIIIGYLFYHKCDCCNSQMLCGDNNFDLSS